MASDGDHPPLTNGEGSVHLLEHTENEAPLPISESTGTTLEDSTEQLAGNPIVGSHRVYVNHMSLLGGNGMGNNSSELEASTPSEAEQTHDTQMEDRATVNGEDQSGNLGSSYEDFTTGDSDMGHSSEARGNPEPVVHEKHSGSDGSAHPLPNPVTAESLMKATLETLDCIFHLEKMFTEHRDYIEAQDAREVPLFQWSNFTGYGTLYEAATDLNKAAEELAAHIDAFGGHNVVPRRVVFLFFNSAVKNSISISKTAQFVLETMNRKSIPCFEEVDQSPLGDAAKDAAKIEITTEVSKFMKHISESTRSVYAALDLLLKLYYEDVEKDQLSLAAVTGTGPGSRTRQTEAEEALWPMWKVLTTGFFLFVMALIVLVAFDMELDKWKLVPEDLQHVTTPDSSQIGKMMDYVRTIDEARKYDKKVVHASLKKFDTRCRSAEVASEELGARLDNIVESLGPTNQDGMYFDQSNAFKACKQSDTLILHLQEQNGKLEEELIRLRKHIHLVDLRLTKDVNRLQRKG